MAGKNDPRRGSLDRRRPWVVAVLASIGCLCAGFAIEITAADPFFATGGTTRASAVAGSGAYRVSLGSTRTKLVIQRGALQTPPNDPARRRNIDKTKQFKFDPFREFGYKQPGARNATGAVRRPTP